MSVRVSMLIWSTGRFEIRTAEKDGLDRAEGLGFGYSEQNLEIVTGSGRCEAIAYIADRKDPSLIPYHWYKELVLSGAQENGLPAFYVEEIARVESKSDPDSSRSAKMRALLEA